MFKYTVRKDGRLMKRVSVNGKIQSIYADSPKELEKIYIEKKSLSNKGIYANDEGLSLGEWADKWVELYKSDKEEATQKMYKDAIRLYIKPNIGFIKLKNLRQSHITEMLTSMQKKGITREREIVLLTIKQIFDKAVENDYIYKNVAHSIKIQKHIPNEKQPISNETIEYIKQLAPKDDRVFMILFMLYTGLRREEVVPLRFSDINIINRNITINKAIHFSNNKPLLKTTKNRQKRIIPILDILYVKLKEMKENHSDKDLVFTNTLGKMHTETSLRRTLEHTLKEINKLYLSNSETLDTQKSVSKESIKFTYHQLRHTYACILHKANIDLKEAQYLMGHQDIRMLLNIYTHLDNEDKEKATQKLNNFIKI